MIKKLQLRKHQLKRKKTLRVGNFLTLSPSSQIFYNMTHKKNNIMQKSLFDTTWFVFQPIDLNSPEAVNLIQRNYTKKQIGQTRYQSMLHFLSFQCMCSSYSERRSSVFLQHILETYNAQRGRCAISGQPLQRPMAYTECDPRFFCSIDRINNDRGYEVGNVRLTLQWINHAMGGRKNPEEMIAFGAIMCLENILCNQEHFIQKYKIKSEIVS